MTSAAAGVKLGTPGRGVPLVGTATVLAAVALLGVLLSATARRRCVPGGSGSADGGSRDRKSVV